jgi:succinate-semialdehyde dehydrogenase/glutarate-semialdehyde dehydrogenase
MWRDALPKEGAAVLHRWYVLILEHANSLGKLISVEQGKPLAEGRGEVSYSASYVAWFADEATRTLSCRCVPGQRRPHYVPPVKKSLQFQA